MHTDAEFFRSVGIAVDEPREEEHRGRALFWILALPMLLALDYAVLKLIVKVATKWLS